jgi:hypothetical protein
LGLEHTVLFEGGAVKDVSGLIGKWGARRSR